MSNRTAVTAPPSPVARREVLAGVAMAVTGFALDATEARGSADDLISHSADEASTVNEASEANEPDKGTDG